MSNESRQDLKLLLSFIMTLVLGANAYFVKNLVDKIDRTYDIAVETRTELRIFKAQLGESEEFSSPRVQSSKRRKS